MYKDGDWWTIEFAWTHVNDCPECDRLVAKTDTEMSEQP